MKCWFACGASDRELPRYLEPARHGGTAASLRHDTAVDQEGVLNTVTRIGLELSAQPGIAGESRDGNARILFKHPLVVWYEIHERMKEVVIYEVRPSRR
jgi:hypothetical protein